MSLYTILTLLFISLISCNQIKTRQLIFVDSTKITEDSIKITEKKKVAGEDYFHLAEQFDENLYSQFCDTSLKGGFSILYSSDSVNQFLIYKKKDVIIDTIGLCLKGLPYRTLGFVVADFEKAFIFAQSYGSRNPTTVQLYEKEKAKNLINEGSALIAVDDIKQIMMFSENEFPKLNDSLTLYDIKRNIKKKYEFPHDIFGEPDICNRIRLKSITNKSFVLEYELNGRQKAKQKKYSR